MHLKIKSLIGTLLVLSLSLAVQSKAANITTTVCPGVGCVDYTIGNNGSIAIQITGTFSGTITFQSSTNNSTFVSLRVVKTSDATATGITTTTSGGIFQGTVTGLSIVRIVFTSWVSGTAVITPKIVSQAAKFDGGGGGVPGGGTVTEVDTASPITGGPITTTGTVSCSDCGLKSGTLGQFASTTSAQLASVISNETGTGLLVFGTAPTLAGTVPFTGNATFTNTNGISFGAVASPITVIGGDDGFGDSALIIDDAGDSYLTLVFPSFPDIFFPSGASLNGTIDFFGGLVHFKNRIHVDQNFGGTPTVANTTAYFQYYASNGIVGAIPSTAQFQHSYVATDQLSSAGGSNVNITTDFGTGGIASIGNAGGLNNFISISGNGSALDEHVPIANNIRVDIGTGYPQTTGPVGRIWGTDYSTLGPIAVQPNTLNGVVQIINEYFNGSPADSPAAGQWIVTGKGLGGGSDSLHNSANTYPVDVGLGIVGTSNNGSAQIGFTVGIQVGGSGSPWGETLSKIGTAIHIRDYNTAGITFDNIGASTAPDIALTGFISGIEMTAPTAPAANGWRLYGKDTGGGKTTLCALFNTGAEQCFATQP